MLKFVLYSLVIFLKVLMPLVNERTMLYVLKPSHDSRNCVKASFC